MKKNKIRLGIVVPAFFYVPYWIAKEHGYFDQFNLDVDVSVSGGIDPLTSWLKSGDVEIGIGSPEHVIHDVESGGELRMVAGNVNRPTHSLIVQSEIKSISDLKGKVLGVSALSGGTSSLFIDILERSGLKHPQDFTIVEAGVVPPRHEKLLSREIDAAMQTDPHNYMGEDAGFNNLGSVSDWIPYFQFNSVNVSRRWANENREMLVGFLTASILASKWLFANKDGAIEVAEKYMQIDRQYLERAWYDHTTGEALPSDLRLEKRSIQTALSMMQRDRSVSLSTDAPPEKYVDLSFLMQAQRAAGIAETPLL